MGFVTKAVQCAEGQVASRNAPASSSQVSIASMLLPTTFVRWSQSRGGHLTGQRRVGLTEQRHTGGGSEGRECLHLQRPTGMPESRTRIFSPLSPIIVMVCKARRVQLRPTPAWAQVRTTVMPCGGRCEESSELCVGSRTSSWHRKRPGDREGHHPFSAPPPSILQHPTTQSTAHNPQPARP
jgi:hypothetical protein